MIFRYWSLPPRVPRPFISITSCALCCVYYWDESSAPPPWHTHSPRVFRKKKRGNRFSQNITNGMFLERRDCVQPAAKLQTSGVSRHRNVLVWQMTCSTDLNILTVCSSSCSHSRMVDNIHHHHGCWNITNRGTNRLNPEKSRKKKRSSSNLCVNEGTRSASRSWLAESCAHSREKHRKGGNSFRGFGFNTRPAAPIYPSENPQNMGIKQFG